MTAARSRARRSGRRRVLGPPSFPIIDSHGFRSIRFLLLFSIQLLLIPQGVAVPRDAAGLHLPNVLWS